MRGVNWLLNPLAELGGSVKDVLVTGGRVLRFGVGVLRHGLWPLPSLDDFLSQCWVLVWQCLLPVILVVVPMGALMSLQGAAMIQSFGVERLLAPITAMAVVRELAPGFAAVVVAMKAGTSVAAEIAVMRVRDELDAYEMMAVDPLRHVVAPRLVAGAFMTPLLAGVSLALALLGSWLVAVSARQFAPRAFIDGCLSAITAWDLAAAMIKSVVFGTLLSTVACFEGYNADKSAAGVGRATNRSVVGAILGILIANYVLNSVLYTGGMWNS